MTRACFNPKNLYKPDFAFKTPEGFRDEQFQIPFTFTVPGNGAPIQNLAISADDDVPWLLRGLFFPQLGLKENQTDPPATGFGRIWDAKGNPMSQGIVLTLGAWCQCGGDELCGWGFSFDNDLYVDAGGAVRLDLICSTNASWARADMTFGGDSIRYDANIYGTSGNGRQINLINPGAPNVALSVAAVGGTVVNVTLATNGGGAVISTSQQVIDAINSSAAAIAVMSAQLLGGDGTAVVAADSENLTGAEASQPVTYRGTLIGVKRFRECI